jgi:hypothetical protein
MILSRLMWNGYLAYHLYGQNRFPFQPPDMIKRVQMRRVRNMVLHAYRTVPYYRETMDRLGLTADHFHTADDLARLPSSNVTDCNETRSTSFPNPIGRTVVSSCGPEAVPEFLVRSITTERRCFRMLRKANASVR